MSKTRILVVDDDKSMLNMLDYGFKRLGPDFEVCLATDIFSAINQIENKGFDLILTDYMMPGMTGVDLARAVHRIAPDTQIILMTAYGTDKLRDTSSHIGVDGYINKPFDMEDIREVLQQLATQARSAKETRTQTEKSPTVPKSIAGSSADSEAPPQTIEGALEKLQVNAGTWAVILVNSDGEPVKVAGQIEQARATSIAGLVASNFLATAELSELLDNQTIFKSGFYEGDSHNIYICTVNEKMFLAVVFDVRLRPGVVWFYTKQTATALASLLK